MSNLNVQLEVRQHRATRVALATGLAAALWCAIAGTQEPPNRDSATVTTENGAVLLQVDSARPVARAVLTLQARYGYVITYEDPRYSHDDDLVDAAAAVRKNYAASRPGSAKALLVPKAGKLTVRLPAAASITSQQLATILNQLVRAQGISTHGGHFRIEQSGDVFHVLPAEVRDRNGNWSPQTSLLDRPISLPVQDRSEEELYRAIAAAVSAAAHVSLDVVMNNGFVIGPAQEQRTNVGATHEPARSVLMRALQSNTLKRTWVLLHTTEDGNNAFSLNILDIPIATPAAADTPQ